MKIYRNLIIEKKHRNSVVAIGNFDGVHLGHQKVLRQAKIKSKKERLPFGLITFEPMPVMFFNPKIKNHRINQLSQKKNQLEKLKLDFLVIVKFNKKFSLLSAEYFIKKIIKDKIQSRFIFVSKNFRFGKNRKGNISLLKNYEKKLGYKTIITSPLNRSKRIISSTIIRKKIKKGNISEVNKLLGRTWSIEGKVVKGKRRGRLIGFPTCNLKMRDYVIPKLGVYSVIVQTKQFKKRGIANIGYRPTFNGLNLLLEVNIFGINKNLYNKELIVKFIKFIRSEKKFKGLEQLKKQIKFDIVQSKKND
ncbi:bifunctional riboflavin kinase/FAD synthetase [Candidatus Pelagibacter bacterium]|nr:bifunctional riboflavin kinase/FAD synthetase [Candidatus Pelagibacter bacterium]